ncbi:MAG TPA: cytochrome c oxidase subunit II [Candidatus Acidoferrales bacterium]|nr:cytochrome c oxidase subunit II [Candidatus Acidoferrales bacterium]
MTGISQFGLALAALIPIHPPAASSIAEGVDQLYYFLTGISIFFSVLIFTLIFYFMIRYRRRSPEERPPDTHTSLALELTWTLIPSGICAILFVWASMLYIQNSRPPAASTEVFVIGKQWMWHIQHPEGPREIDELHVPVDEPIKVTITSQDVIHGFYIPAFRVKKDALPGRYTSIWFQATKIGTYHLFCSEYCGANHSQMIGQVFVMSRSDYANWLSAQEKTESMAQQGQRLFSQLGCESCHLANATGRGPSLAGVYGRPEKLQSGETRVVDENLIRQAIIFPNSVLLPNYPAIMPTFQGQVNDEQLLQLIAYVKSLGAPERTNGK